MQEAHCGTPEWPEPQAHRDAARSKESNKRGPRRTLRDQSTRTIETVMRVSHALPGGDDFRKLRSKGKQPMAMFVAARWMFLICGTRRTMAMWKTRMIGHDQEGRGDDQSDLGRMSRECQKTGMSWTIPRVLLRRGRKEGEQGLAERQDG